MTDTGRKTSLRKKDHIEICLNEDVSFSSKTTGFERYDFEHYAITELKLGEIDLRTRFFGKKIDYPFIISCMTGGTSEAESINHKLAEAAGELNIPIGAGSQRQALENREFVDSFNVIRKRAGNVPVLGNIGGAQLSKFDDPVASINELIAMLEADAMVVHLNAAQELLQPEGEPDFRGLLKNLEKACKKVKTPIIIKEVGAGISKKAAKRLLEIGVRGIDVAGAGGTSWTAVEMVRGTEEKEINKNFWDWGIPTSDCIRTVKKLKKDHKFMLIGSGGIRDGAEIAKAIALGADLTASAGSILREVNKGGTEGVIRYIRKNFEDVKRIMYLTNCRNISELKKTSLTEKRGYH